MNLCKVNFIAPKRLESFHWYHVNQQGLTILCRIFWPSLNLLPLSPPLQAQACKQSSNSNSGAKNAANKYPPSRLLYTCCNISFWLLCFWTPVQVVSTNLVSFNFRSDPDVSSMEEVDENRRSSRRKSLVATKSNPDMREETPRGRRVS